MTQTLPKRLDEILVAYLDALDEHKAWIQTLSNAYTRFISEVPRNTRTIPGLIRTDT